MYMRDNSTEELEGSIFLLLAIGIDSQFSHQFSRSVVSDSATPWTAAGQVSLSITSSRNLLKLMSITPVSDAIQPSHPLSSPSLPAFSLSQYQSLFQ